MKTTDYPGIDYACGQAVNRNTETGLRYGVIPSQDISPDAFEGIVQHGTDEDFESYKREILGGIKSSLESTLGDYMMDDSISKVIEAAKDEAENWIGDDYQGSGDCTRYSYEKDGVKLQVASDGDIFVIESPFFTYAQFCSPCAPGACYLRSPLETPVEANKAYCLGHDWFDSDSPCPYPVYSVKTGELVSPSQDW